MSATKQARSLARGSNVLPQTGPMRVHKVVPVGSALHLLARCRRWPGRTASRRQAVCGRRSSPPGRAARGPGSEPCGRPGPVSQSARRHLSSWTNLLWRWQHCCSRAGGRYRCHCPTCRWRLQNLRRRAEKIPFSPGQTKIHSGVQEVFVCEEGGGRTCEALRVH